MCSLSGELLSCQRLNGNKRVGGGRGETSRAGKKRSSKGRRKARKEEYGCPRLPISPRHITSAPCRTPSTAHLGLAGSSPSQLPQHCSAHAPLLGGALQNVAPTAAWWMAITQTYQQQLISSAPCESRHSVIYTAVLWAARGRLWRGRAGGS